MKTRTFRQIGLLFLALCAAGSIPAAMQMEITTPLSFGHREWNVAEFAKSGYALGLAQSPDGFLWIATPRGLFRFDGYEFKLMSPQPVEALAVDESDCWAGGEGRLFHWADHRLETILLPKPFDSFVVRRIGIHPEGGLWLADFKRMLRFRGGRITEPIQTPVSGRDSLLTFDQEKDGRLLLGTLDGLIALESGRPVSRLLPRTAVTSILPLPDGRRLLGTNRGVFSLEGEQVRPLVDQPGLKVRQLYYSAGGLVLISTHGQGVLALKDDWLVSMPFFDPIQRQIVSGLIQDREGSLWIATYSGSLHQIWITSIHTFSSGDGLPADTIACVAEGRPGEIWVGSLGGGAARLVGDRWIRAGPESGLPDPLVCCLLVDSRGDVWAATHETGLFCRRGDRFQPVTDQDGRRLIHSFTSLVENPPGTVWAGAEHGLYRLERGRVTGRWDRHPSGAELKVITLSPRAPGGIWVGTGAGLVAMTADGRLEACPDPTVGSEGISAIFEDGRGACWMGLHSGELWRLRGGRYGRVRIPPEMIQGSIWAIVPDRKEHLWFHTDDGIIRVPRNKLEMLADGIDLALPYQKIGLADGLNSLLVPQPGFPSAIRLADGRLAFATTAGLAIALPGQRMYPSPNLRTYIDQLRINDAEHPVTDWPELPPGPKKVEIGFVAPNFRNPAAVGYRYRLVGIEEGWTAAGARRQAAYANLPHGAYTFEVQAFRGSGGQTSEVTRFSFRILPHVWETVWFRALAGLGLVLLGFSTYRVRVARLQRQKRHLEEQVIQRTSQLAQSNAELAAAKGDLEAANRQLERLAAHDALTGLANRRCFDEHLAAEWKRAARFRYPVSLLMADVDLFKRYNDTFGHPAGDDCLRQVGRVLRSRSWRTGDLPARFGGEEFVVLLAASDAAGASAVAEEIRAGLADLAIPHVPDKSPPVVTLSVGVATAADANRSSPAALLKQADEALYAAKQAGRNRVSMFRPSEAAGAQRED